MSKIPILVLAFNRPNYLSRAMATITKYQPDRIYLACDGPRPNNAEDVTTVMKTRQVMVDTIDWPCEVYQLFRETNLGCAQAPYQAISWFFEHEEYGIIIEDDVIVSQDFFKLCEDLLPRYKDEERIMQISSRNTSQRTDLPNTYVYTQVHHCWGWASWRRAWKKMDMEMANLSKVSIWYLIKRIGIVRGVVEYSHFVSISKDLAHSTEWDVRWFFSIISNDGLVICPGVNLGLNIGFAGGTHFDPEDANRPGAKLLLHEMNWPLVYNDSLTIDRLQKHYDSRFYLINRYIGLRKKIKRNKRK